MPFGLPGAHDIEVEAEKAEDHLGVVVTERMIPALIKALSDLAAHKKITITIQFEDRT